MRQRRLLLGNEAITRGLVENGCRMATSYPGTPASEILAAVAGFKLQEKLAMHVQWAVNEKIAFEVAYAGAIAGLRTAVSMKQVGLKVASDPFMSAAYMGVKGGFLVISADDPGPHSSQTEQDSRMMAMQPSVATYPYLKGVPDELCCNAANAVFQRRAEEKPMSAYMTEFVSEQRRTLAEQVERFREEPDETLREDAVTSADDLKSLKAPVRAFARSGVRLATVSQQAMQHLIELESEVITSALTAAAMRLERAAKADNVVNLIRDQAAMFRATRDRIAGEATRAVEMFKVAGRDVRKVGRSCTARSSSGSRRRFRGRKPAAPAGPSVRPGSRPRVSERSLPERRDNVSGR